MGARACKLGGRFSRCPNPRVDTCQYCGKDFCQQHMHLRQDHEAVCSAKKCAAKCDDLAQHLVYRDRVGQRNHAGLCGIEGCGPHPEFECSLCLGLFCGLHVQEKLYPFRDGWLTTERPVSVCPSCWERRKIWRR